MLSPSLSWRCWLSCLSFEQAVRNSLTPSRVTPISSRVLYLIAISSLVTSLVKTAGVCAILDSSGNDVATALLAWKVMRSIDWLAVMPEFVAQLLSFSMESSTVSVFTIEGSTRLIRDKKQSIVAQTLLPAVLNLSCVTRYWELLCDVLWPNICIVLIDSHSRPLFLVSAFLSRV